MNKICRVCHAEKPASKDYFGFNRRYTDGFDTECKACRHTRWMAGSEQSKKWRQEYNDANRSAVREWRARIRAEMIEAYGGACACCGETQDEFLQLDHVGGRNADNHPWASHYRGSTIYGKLKKMGWPKDIYRLLCANCNWAVRWNKVCPHQRRSLRVVRGGISG